MGLIERAKRVKELVSLRFKYRHVFETPEGQAVLRDICRLGFISRPTFSDNPQRTALNEGQRRLALAILSRAVQDPYAFVKTITEEEHDN